MWPSLLTIGSEHENEWLQEGETYQPEDVILNIYDVSRLRAFGALNSIGLMFGGGAFHVGTEVFSREWTYGHIDDTRSSTSGVFAVPPKRHLDHHYRGSIKLGTTTFGRTEVRKIIKELAKTWKGRDYSVLKRNCVHFAAELIGRLGAGSLPPCVDFSARLCKSFSGEIDRIWGAVDANKNVSCRLSCLTGPASPTEVVLDEEVDIMVDRSFCFASGFSPTSELSNKLLDASDMPDLPLEEGWVRQPPLTRNVEATSMLVDDAYAGRSHCDAYCGARHSAVRPKQPKLQQDFSNLPTCLDSSSGVGPACHV
eukprot:TRINITY_DN52517_c0_g1_i1.p1 TRINITY_DN52517_c0_g1~~TRINITY_DN52517_c0_g1_i1.p1  ORF type:complete len:311 (+),score=39.16 TRINITY_DN52517_c0_g1_i1:66-998(+)